MNLAPLSPPLTILHIFSGDLWAGAEVMIFNLLAELHLDEQVRSVALSLNEGVLTSKLRAVGVETHVIPEAQFSFPSILLRAARLLRLRKIDLIHSHRYKENLLAFLLGKFLGVKAVIATIHGLPESPNIQNARGNFLSLLDRLLLRNFFAHAVAVSHDMKMQLVESQRFSPVHVSVIHNGIRIEGCSLPDNGPEPLVSRHHTFHIGSVGRLVPVKDFALFLEIAAGITRESQNVRFSILGDGPCKTDLEEKANRLGLNGHFSVIPATQDPMAYYTSLDIYLSTSLHEGVPMSVLEAMACGVPVIAAKVGGLSEIITDEVHGFLVEGRDPAGFVRRCFELLKDTDRRHIVRESAFRRVTSEFSAVRMAREYSARYLNLL